MKNPFDELKRERPGQVALTTLLGFCLLAIFGLAVYGLASIFWWPI